MAKNRDRRRDKKPDPPEKGDPPALRRARPDLLLRVYRHVHDDCRSSRWNGWTPMQVAKAMGEHADDVADCLLHMIRTGEVIERGGTYFVAPPKPAPPPPPKACVDPALLLRVRKVFSRVATAGLEDLGGGEDVQKCIDELVNKGHLAKLKDGSYHAISPPTSAPWASARPSFDKHEYRGNGKCPWCESKTRRHARNEVHDIGECRLRMIANIMKE
jgi:hypothetical protein